MWSWARSSTSWTCRYCSSDSRTRTTCQCTLDRWACIGGIQATQYRQKDTTKIGFSLRWQLVSIDFGKSGRFDARAEEHTHKYHDTSWKNIRLDQYTAQELRDVFLEMFCATRTAVDNPMMQPSGIGQRRSFLVLEEGELEGTDGYWAEDDEDHAEGFLDALEDVFWVCDDAEFTWYQRRFQGRHTRRGKGKGRRKGEGKRKKRKKILSRERNLSKMISLCKTHMNSHPDVQGALSRERNLWINGNSNVPHQAVQNLQKMNQNKKMHFLQNKMIPWVQR